MIWYTLAGIQLLLLVLMLVLNRHNASRIARMEARQEAVIGHIENRLRRLDNLRKGIG